jgi:hypothetical protein
MAHHLKTKGGYLRIVKVTEVWMVLDYKNPRFTQIAWCMFNGFYSLAVVVIYYLQDQGFGESILPSRRKRISGLVFAMTGINDSCI